MSEKNNELKAAAVFAFGLHPSPVVELTTISNMKSGGLFVPAIEAKVVAGPGQVSTVKFALLACDLLSEEEIEKFRVAIHQRIDKAIDGYKAKWTPAKDVTKAASEAPSELTSSESSENPA